MAKPYTSGSQSNNVDFKYELQISSPLSLKEYGSNRELWSRAAGGKKKGKVYGQTRPRGGCNSSLWRSEIR
ncbi:hypothetical protein L1987_64448 [Smallanthus sonchifolius]|uniref:Uncharacterized protein n=1 Tax=Smallanthus sonchifolius TaxID=185202 RepID=A0ACB9CG55_9ASTR|nr:hypothetical protein L1987_64448 [Smallanthus sonchifolius]